MIVLVLMFGFACLSTGCENQTSLPNGYEIVRDPVGPPLIVPPSGTAKMEGEIKKYGVSGHWIIGRSNIGYFVVDTRNEVMIAQEVETVGEFRSLLDRLGIKYVKPRDFD